LPGPHNKKNSIIMEFFYCERQQDEKFMPRSPACLQAEKDEGVNLARPTITVHKH